MTKPWPKVKLGEVLAEQKQRVGTIDADEISLLGVSNHQGLHRSGMPRISDMSRYLRVEKRWFAYNPMRINVGSIGWAQSDEQTGVISPDYVVFSCTEKILPELVFAYLRHPVWLDEINKATAGSVRERLYFHKLAQIEIPLPPLAEQRRIVARIEELAAQIHEAKRLRKEAAEEGEAMGQALSSRLFRQPDGKKVENYIRFQTGYAFKSEWFTANGVRPARNANVSHGVLDWSETVRIDPSRTEEFERFALHEGDILVSLDRPIISTGVKVAQVRKHDLPCLLLQRVARVQFVGNDVLPQYFYRWLRSPHFVNATDPGRSNGVPHISHKDIERIPFSPPPIPEQRRIVAELDALQAEVDGLRRLQAETARELDALVPAMLDRAFRGEI